MFRKKTASLKRGIYFFVSVFSLILNYQYCHAWNLHPLLTQLAVQETFQTLVEENVKPAPIQKALEQCSLKDVLGDRPLLSASDLELAMQIHPDRVNWNKDVASKIKKAGEVLYEASVEPDLGFDQDLRVEGSSQKYMGGFEGSSSQGFRHMYYEKWQLSRLAMTFHFPPWEMGEAPNRAELFFKISKTFKKCGDQYWSMRFLGWGMHYIQDISQPYHTNQFASFVLVKWVFLLKGWNALIQETTRQVGNHHLSFEYHADLFLKKGIQESDPEVLRWIQDPEGDAVWTHRLGLQRVNAASVKKLAVAGNLAAPRIVKAQRAYYGAIMDNPKLNLISEFQKPDSVKQIDYAEVDRQNKQSENREEYFRLMFIALQNSARATRWYLQQWRID